MALYQLKYRTRVIEPQKGHASSIRFFVGTCSVTEENQLHLVEFNDDEEEVMCVNVYPHSPEVVALAASPSDPALLVTSFNQTRGSSVSNNVGLWRIGGDEATPKLDMAAELCYPPEKKRERGCVSGLLWEQGFAEMVFTVEPGRLAGWNLAQLGTGPAMEVVLSPEDSLAQVGGASLNPHIATVLAVCVGDSVLGFDTREAGSARGVPVWKLRSATDEHVRDCDFNPNKPYFLCCGGDEGRVRFWDYRKPSEFVQQSFPPGSQHSHWITTVEYNPHHDSLVLSSGTDGLVNLYNAKSVSSSTAVAAGAASDYLIASYNGFGQSAYRAVWATEAWVYGAVSWDGKAVFSSVPDKEKMTILTE